MRLFPSCRAPAPSWLPVLCLSWLPLLLAAPGEGQTTWSLEAGLGYGLGAELFRHTTSWSRGSDGPLLVNREELRLEPGLWYGLRAERRSVSGWAAGAEVARAPVEYRYYRSASSGDLTQSDDQRGTATVWSAGLSAGRDLRLAPATLVRIRLVGELRRADLELPCPAPPPSGGFPVPCIGPPNDRFAFGAAGLTAGVEQRISRWLALRVDGGATFGKADTSAFWSDLRPELDHLEAPRSHGVWSGRVGAGIAVGFPPRP